MQPGLTPTLPTETHGIQHRFPRRQIRPQAYDPGSSESFSSSPPSETRSQAISPRLRPETSELFPKSHSSELVPTNI